MTDARVLLIQTRDENGNLRTMPGFGIPWLSMVDALVKDGCELVDFTYQTKVIQSLNGERSDRCHFGYYDYEGRTALFNGWVRVAVLLDSVRVA